ncbi:MAG: DNA primase [Planctomycetaceae bacterium]|nr:DNA primase [Planctomycetaceae bacterium]
MSTTYDQNAVKERIRDAVDIVELVGHYIPLRRQGRNYVGRCPWHDDTRPSLQVNPERQTFKCWVCDIGGDVFAFTMKINNVDFREALQILSDKTGIPLPKFLTADGRRQTAEDGQEITRKELLRAADWVAKIYHEALLQNDEAEVVRNYLAARNVSMESIKKFRIGYAPIDRNWLANKAGNKPERIKVLEIIGNLKTADGRRQTAADFFRGRLVFPIRDEQGRTVAFGGRLIPNSPLANDDWHKDRKYLNSPETTLFSKHKVLYGLDTAKQRIKETRRALIMEGYTDCIAAHQFGFGEAVAVLGTALGPAHIRLLNRMGAEKIILMLDGDKAGQAKAESSQVLTDFIAQGADMAVLTLPEGLDPCDFLEQENGPEKLDELLQTQAVDALEHVFRAKTRGIDIKNDIIGSSKALDAILEIIGHAPVKGTAPDDPIRFRVEKMIQSLSVRFRMPEDEVRRRLREKQKTADGKRQTVADASGTEASLLPSAVCRLPSDMPDLLERDMLELWILDPTAIYEFWEPIAPEQFRSPITLSIYQQCCDLIDHQDKLATFDNLMTAFDDPWMKNYLIELEDSGRKKFFPNDDEDDEEIDPAFWKELSERWKEPEFKELKAKLIAEIIAAFNQRETDRERRDDVNKLRNPELSEEEKLQQLLELQRKLRKPTESSS